MVTECTLCGVQTGRISRCLPCDTKTNQTTQCLHEAVACLNESNPDGAMTLVTQAIKKIDDLRRGA